MPSTVVSWFSGLAAHFSKSIVPGNGVSSYVTVPQGRVVYSVSGIATGLLAGSYDFGMVGFSWFNAEII